VNRSFLIFIPLKPVSSYKITPIAGTLFLKLNVPLASEASAAPQK